MRPPCSERSDRMPGGVPATALYAASTPAGPPRSTRQELEASVCARALAWLTGDFESYFRHTTGSYRWSGAPIPELTRSQSSGAPPFEIDDLHIVEYRDLSIVSYVLTVCRNERAGAPFDRWRRTEVWTLEDGHWKAAAADSHEASRTQ